MYFPEQADAVLIDAIAQIRGIISQCPPEATEKNAIDAAFGNIERSLLKGIALRNAFVNGSMDAVFVVDLEEEELYWGFVNPSFARLVGKNADALLGTALAAEPMAFRFEDRCREALSVGAPVKYEDKFEDAGCRIEIQTRLTPIRDMDGMCRAIVGVSRDVSEQRNAERLLRKQNRRLQNILDSISDGFVTVDREWRILFVNTRAEQILGAPRTLLTGSSFWDSFPSVAGEKFRQAAEGAGVNKPCAQTVVCDDNRWLSLRTFPSQEGAAIYIQDISDRKQAEQSLKQGLERTQASLDGIVNAMVFAVEMRDPYTGGHQRRVSALACAIARKLALPLELIETLRIAGLLHDVGKISIPTEILNRPGKLSDPERIIVRTHAQTSYEILKEIEFASPVALIALQHHERLDGSGYPQGLNEESIIPEARILAVADVVEAMASHRPYRPALGIELALKEIMSHSGLKYDTRAVDACLSVFTESGFDFDQLIQTEMAHRHTAPLV